ncbi:hypothetical protein FRC10_002368 [Ceratobasidium sp. 414]|nr:hypothetical protein FRC10_002368 [Ceratobasidium sp. 414]
MSSSAQPRKKTRPTKGQSAVTVSATHDTPPVLVQAHDPDPASSQVKDTLVPMSQLSQKKQATAKAKLNQVRAEQMQPKVTTTKYDEELAKAKRHLLGYCKVSLLSDVHMNTTLHPGPNPCESVEATVANLTQDFKENRVLDAANPISVRVDPGELTPQCLATIKDCQDPQKVEPGEAPPVLAFKWWAAEELACKRLNAAFGVNFRLSGLLDATSQREVVHECNGLGDKNYTAELMAGSHCAKAAVQYAKEFIEEMRRATKEGDMQGVLSIVQKASTACSFWAACYSSALPHPTPPVVPLPAGDMDEPSRIWAPTNQPTIFQLMTTGETAFMSMRAWHAEGNEAREQGKSEEEAFTAGYKCVQEMGSVHVGTPGHFLLEVLGPCTVHQLVEALSRFAPIVNNSISSDFAKHTLCRDEIGGVTCTITLMSTLKLHHMSHFSCMLSRFTDPPFDLPDWKAFMRRVEGHIPEMHEICSSGSELMDDFLEELLEVPSPEVLRTNLSHLVMQDLLNSIDSSGKEHQPELTMGKGMMGPKTPPGR